MVDPVVGTAAPATFPLPTWLTQGWETSTVSEIHSFVKSPVGSPPPATYDFIELHDFKFLGKTFESAQYSGFDVPPDPDNPNAPRRVLDGPFTATGVCLELKELLVEAQHGVFQLYAQRQASRGQPATEEGFADFCLVNGLHKGFQPRDGKHKRGAAIDIDPTFNPYVPTGDRAVPATLGGETPRRFSGGGGSARDRAALQQIRLDALTAYDHAVAFMFGSTQVVNVKNRSNSETPKQLYDRFNIVHHALTLYFSCGFNQFATKNRKGVFIRNNSIPRTAVVDAFDTATIADAIRQKKGLFRGGNAPQRTNDQPFLIQLRQDLVKDHSAMRAAAIYGKWDIVNGVQSDFSSSRDPNFGIMFLVEQVVVPMLKPNLLPGRSLRWGAIDFNTQSGDIMHFDIGSAADTVAIKRTAPNTKGAFYGP